MKILDALLVLKEQALTNNVFYAAMGICTNLAGLTEDSDSSYDFVRDNCEDWEHFSCDTSYPIEGYDDGHLWEGEQLELRLSLIDHLIAKARELEI